MSRALAIAFTLAACTPAPSSGGPDGGGATLPPDAGPQPEDGLCVPGAGGCTASLACVPTDSARALGFCSPICYPGTEATKCTSGKTCAIGVGESRGVCVTEVPNGQACAPASRLFCAAANRAACIFLAAGDPSGICFSLCNLKALKDECTQRNPAQKCLAVLGKPDVGLCLATAQQGQACGLDLETICDRGLLCVAQQALDGTVTARCAVDCAGGAAACPSGTSCTTLNGGQSSACL